MKEAKFILPFGPDDNSSGHTYAGVQLNDKFAASYSNHIGLSVTADDRKNASGVLYSAAIRPEEYLSIFRRIACTAARLEGCCAVYMVDCEGTIEIVNVADRKTDEEQEHVGVVYTNCHVEGSGPISKKTPWLNELWLTRDGSLVLVDSFWETALSKTRCLLISILRSKSDVVGSYSVYTDGMLLHGPGSTPLDRDLVSFVAPYR